VTHNYVWDENWYLGPLHYSQAPLPDQNALNKVFRILENESKSIRLVENETMQRPCRLAMSSVCARSTHIHVVVTEIIILFSAKRTRCLSSSTKRNYTI
jgi:hypothetical protein